MILDEEMAGKTWEESMDWVNGLGQWEWYKDDGLTVFLCFGTWIFFFWLKNSVVLFYGKIREAIE